MPDKEMEYVLRRSRSAAIVVRDGKILMERVFYFGREFFTVPGGGIEPGETPEQAVLRELKEECGLDGTIVRPLAVQYKDGGAEYSFEVSIPEDQEPVTGYDPENDIIRVLDPWQSTGIMEFSYDSFDGIWSLNYLEDENDVLRRTFFFIVPYAELARENGVSLRDVRDSLK